MRGETQIQRNPANMNRLRVITSTGKGEIRVVRRILRDIAMGVSTFEWINPFADHHLLFGPGFVVGGAGEW
jgi:hypothetical protein